MVLSVPFIKPETLRLSGGCIGAKRMQWFMAHSANAVARERGLGIHFQVILPMLLERRGLRHSGSAGLVPSISERNGYTGRYVHDR